MTISNFLFNWISYSFLDLFVLKNIYTSVRYISIMMVWYQFRNCRRTFFRCSGLIWVNNLFYGNWMYMFAFRLYLILTWPMMLTFDLQFAYVSIKIESLFSQFINGVLNIFYINRYKWYHISTFITWKPTYKHTSWDWICFIIMWISNQLC